MPSYFVSWIVVLGMATVVTGCASATPSGGMMEVDQSDHHRLISPPASIGAVNSAMLMATSTDSPTESVKNTITDVLSILGNEALKQPGWSEERRQQIEQVIRRRVNVRHMAQRSLGDSWTRLSDKERQEFEGTFVKLIRDTLANKIDQYYDEHIFYLLEQREGGWAQVRTNLIGSKVDTSLDFRLDNQSGEWRMYDLIIDGSSIVWNYRAQFSRIIHDHSYAGLVERMKERVHTVKGFEKTTPAIALLSPDTSESQ